MKKYMKIVAFFRLNARVGFGVFSTDVTTEQLVSWREQGLNARVGFGVFSTRLCSQLAAAK